MPQLDIVCVGVGAGATFVYDGETSSSFIVRVDAKPRLLLDVGGGAIRAVLKHAGCIPDHVYVSHNHTDHAGELPVLLAVESQRGHRMNLLAEPSVLNTLRTHRLHELQSTGRQLSDFGCFTGCPAGQLHELGDGLALLPLKARHAERCFGLLLYWQGQPVLGWSADSGYDAALYTALSAAPVLLLDGRARGTSEHAGFAQLAAAASSGLFRTSKVLVYGYGTQQEAPQSAMYPSLCAVTPGSIIQLAPCTPTPAAQPAADPIGAAAEQPAVPAVRHPGVSASSTAAVAAAAAAAAAAEATAAASAAVAKFTMAAAGGGSSVDVAMQDARIEAADAAGGNGTGVRGLQGSCFDGYHTAAGNGGCQAQPVWPPSAAAAAAVAAAGAVATGDGMNAAGQQHMLDLGGDLPAAVGARGGRKSPSMATCQGAGGCTAGFPGVLQQHHSPHCYPQQRQQPHHQFKPQQQQSNQQHYRNQGRIERQQQQVLRNGMYRPDQQQFGWQQQQQQVPPGGGANAAVFEQRRQPGVSTTTSTSSSTAV